MRRPFLLFYALVFLDEVALLSIVPLVPAYTRAYDLSDVRAGALLSAASLAIVVASVPMVVVVIVLALGDPGPRMRHGHQPLRDIAAGMRTSPLLAGAIAIMLLGGVGDGVVNLVAPLQLADHGLSSGAIGAWLSAASTIFILSSAAVARAGRRAVSLRLAGVLAAFQAAALIPVLLSGAAAPVIVTVLVRSIAVGAPYAMAFPLGALGAG